MVDVKTTEADAIACCIYSLLAVVIANVFVVDVTTTYNIEADVIACYISLLLPDVIANTYVADIIATFWYNVVADVIAR